MHFTHWGFKTKIVAVGCVCVITIVASGDLTLSSQHPHEHVSVPSVTLIGRELLIARGIPSRLLHAFENSWF